MRNRLKGSPRVVLGFALLAGWLWLVFTHLDVVLTALYVLGGVGLLVCVVAGFVYLLRLAAKKPELVLACVMGALLGVWLGGGHDYHNRNS